jgi:4-amino-4-deoxy-L-arabinose transferase-like glycosyltransferase
MPHSAPHVASRIVLVAAAFVTFAAAITSQLPKGFSDFDQSFYLTIAYDIDRYGVFSNGMFDKTDSTREAPPPGMFFVPGYPLLVLAAMKMDSRFAKAVECSVEANHNKRNVTECEVDATPMHIIHAFLLGLGVLAVALSAELIFGSARVFWIAGVLAIGSLSAKADLFSYIMTESMTVSLYSIFALFAVRAWRSSRILYFALAGIFLGLLCLTRASFIVLIPIMFLLVLLNGRWLANKSIRSSWSHILAFATACLIVVGPWMARNHFSVGKWGLTEEYGSATLIERFAYNDMTAWEFMLAFPYCMPGIGDIAFDQVDGKDSMHRFLYRTHGSFFQVGRDRRGSLVNQYDRLDPLIAGIVLDEMRTNWWRHLLVSIPLAWCGMWAWGLWSLVLVPLFGWACVRAVRRARPLLLLYAVPPIAMLGLHALIANPYSRYNLILIGPFSAGAAWIISTSLRNGHLQLRARAPGP